MAAKEEHPFGTLCQHRFLGKESYIYLRMSVKLADWSDKYGRLNAKAPNYQARNAILRNHLTSPEKALSKVFDSGKPFSIHEFKHKFLGNDKCSFP